MVRILTIMQKAVHAKAYALTGTESLSNNADSFIKKQQ
jgi:hypothetical protein